MPKHNRTKSPSLWQAVGQHATYAQLEQRANRGAHALRALGLNTGDTVAISCDNRLEFFDIYWAAQRAGLILVLLSSRFKIDEIAYIVNDSGARTLLVSDAMADTARAAMAAAARCRVCRISSRIGPVDAPDRLDQPVRIHAGHPDL